MDQINYKKQQAQILVNLLETSKFEEAVLKGKPLIKKFPREYLFYNAVGLALINLGKYKDALKILDEAIKLGENNIFVLNNLGLVHYFLRNYEISEKYFIRVFIRLIK